MEVVDRLHNIACFVKFCQHYYLIEGTRCKLRDYYVSLTRRSYPSAIAALPLSQAVNAYAKEDLMTERPYFSYLFRCWQSGQGPWLVWRVSLEDPHTGQRVGFATFDDAIDFLKTRLLNSNDRRNQEQPMTVTLQPITSDNWLDCISLKPTEEQARIGFVAPNPISLVQAHYEPWWQPYAIYALMDENDAQREIMVGFAMYGRWPVTGIPAHHAEATPGIDFILRFMIDGRYQGRGYGRAAMAALIAQIKAQPDGQAIEISYDVTNTVMARLCTSVGFQPTGRIHDGEIQARLRD